MITFPPQSKTEKKTVLHIEVVQSLEILDHYAEPWNQLAKSSGKYFPSMSHAWISAFLRSKREDGKSWFCLFAFDKKELVGVLPVLAREKKNLLFNYLHLSTPFDAHTFSVEFLFKEKYGAEVIRYFIQFIKKIKPVVTGIFINKLSSASPTLSVIEKKIKGIHFNYYPYEYGTILTTKQPFKDYKQSLGKKLRSNLRRSRKQFEELPGNQILIIKSDLAKPENLETFIKLERSGWKGKTGSAISNKDDFLVFFRNLCEELTNRKWIEWYFLRAEDKYIAGYLTIVFGKSCYIFKTGYNEQYQYLSPGTIVTEIMLEEIFNREGIDEINFYSDFEWLNKWKVNQYVYYNLRLAFNTPASLIFTWFPMVVFSRFEWIRKAYRYFKNR